MHLFFNHCCSHSYTYIDFTCFGHFKGAKANVRPIGYLGRGAYFWHHTLDLHWTLLVLIGAIIYVFLLVIFAALFYAGKSHIDQICQYL